MDTSLERESRLHLNLKILKAIPLLSYFNSEICLTGCWKTQYFVVSVI